MINIEELNLSCERSLHVSQIFFEDLGTAANTLGKLIEAQGPTEELKDLYIHINKLRLSYLGLRKEYLGLLREFPSDEEFTTLLDSMETENNEDISETRTLLDKFT